MSLRNLSAVFMVVALTPVLSASPIGELFTAYEHSLNAEPFAPGLVTLPDRGASRCAFSPDGDELLFPRFRPDGKMDIYCVRNVGGVWGPETLASFSGKGCDFEPCYSADGNRVYFTSMRGDDRFNLWYSDKKNGVWGEPRRVSGAVDSPMWELFALPFGGDFFFVSNRDGGCGEMDIYVARGSDGNDAARVENLGKQINTPVEEFDPCPDPAGRFLVYSSGGDLVVSFKNGKGEWGVPVNLGPKVNRPDTTEVAPVIAPGNKVLLFTRFGKDLLPNVYAISLDIVYNAGSNSSLNHEEKK